MSTKKNFIQERAKKVPASIKLLVDIDFKLRDKIHEKYKPKNNKQHNDNYDFVSQIMSEIKPILEKYEIKLK